MAGWIDSPVFKILEGGLDASSLRQRVISNNVANVQTPGFKRSDVDFQKSLEKALGNSELVELKRTSSKHLPGVPDASNKVIVTDQSSILENGNNVDIDREMANVAENGIYYNSVSRTTSMQLAILRLLVNQKA